YTTLFRSYYPGTLEMAAGKDVLITAGAALTAMNFALNDNSVGRAPSSAAVMANTTWTVPVKVTIVGEGRIPVSDHGLFPVLRLTRASDNRIQEVALTSKSVVVPMSASPEY